MIAQLRDFFARLSGLFIGRRLAARIDEELSFHLEMRTEENRKKGMEPEEARYAALRDLGGVDQIKEKHYDVRSFRWIEDCIQDVRFSARMLSRSPGYAFASILILAMAIGPNAAVFSLFRGVLYNAMPYSNSDRLVQINSTHQMASIPFGVSYPDYLDFVKYSRSFDEIGVFANAKVDLNGTGEPERLKAIRVSSSIFKVLKRELLIGRPFNANDDLPEAGGVAILSHGLWMRKFSSDSSILGMKISIDRVPHTIIGVMPADVVFTESRYDFLLPLRVDIGKASRQARDYYPLARLKKGVSVEQARGELSGIAASLEREQVFTNYGVGATVQELGKNYSTNENRLGFQFGFLSVTFVLLIACSNISTLLLARASGRGREFAVRASLGAARTRLVRQLLTESALLALFGAFIGMFLAQGWLKIMLAVSPSDMPNKDVMRVDSASFVYTALIALLSSLIFGIVPALRSTGRQTIDAIKREEHATTGRSRRRLLGSFLVAEAAMTTVLLVFAWLMIRSFQRQMAEAPGFDRTNVLAVHLMLPESKYAKAAQLNSFVESVLSKFRNHDGAEQVAASQSLPMDPTGLPVMQFSIEGTHYDSSSQLPRAAIRVVTADYFKVLRAPLLLGRCFTDFDNPKQPQVIINRRMAEYFFANSSTPLGRRIKLGALDAKGYQWAEIIGVTGNMSEWLASNQIPPYQMYLSYTQYPQRMVALAIRTKDDPYRHSQAARAIIHSVDPEMPVSAIQSMEEIVGERVSGYRMTSRVMSLLSLFALVISSFGIYSVVSYVISQRTREIGIRMAFGAVPKNICLMILRSGLLLLGTGLVIGLGAALASMHYFKAMLFGIAPEDLISYIGSAVIIIAVGIAAILLPVRRAVSVDPMISIRHE